MRSHAVMSGRGNEPIDDRIESATQGPDQPSHGPAGLKHRATEWLIPLLVGAPVALATGLLSTKVLIPRATTRIGMIGALAMPVAATIGAVVGSQLLRLQPKSAAPPDPLPRPGEVALDGSEHGSYAGSDIGTVRGTAESGSERTATLTLGSQVGRLDGYDDRQEALAAATGRGNVAIVESRGRFDLVEIQRSSTASLLMDASRAVPEISDDSVVAIVRGGIEAYVRPADGSDIFESVGAIDDVPSNGRPFPQVDEDLGELAPVGSFDQLGAGNEDVAIDLDHVHGPRIGFASRDEAIATTLQAEGDQVVTELPTGRFLVADYLDTEVDGARLRGITAANPDKDATEPDSDEESDEPTVAMTRTTPVVLEYDGTLYAPSDGRYVRASFEGDEQD